MKRARKAHLARERDVRSNRRPRERGKERKRERDTRGWPVLGHGAFGDVNMNIRLADDRRVDAEAVQAFPHKAQRELRGFLHHIAEFSRELQMPAAGKERTFD